MRRLVPFLALLLVPTAACAQEASSREEGRIQFFNGSVGVGTGGAAGYDQHTFGAHAKVTFATRRYALSARFIKADEFKILGAAPGLKFTEVGLLAGVRRRLAGGWLLARAQAGPGLVIDYRHGAPIEDSCEPRQWFCSPSYERERGLAVGVAGEAELLLTPFRYAGLGLRLGGNANTVRSFFGMSVALHIGRLY